MQHVVDQYFKSIKHYSYISPSRNTKNLPVFFHQFYLSDINNNKKNEFFFSEQIVVNVSIQINQKIENNLLAIVLANSYNPRISVFFKDISELPTGLKNIKLILPPSIIAPGNYFFNFFLYTFNDKIFEKIENACSFQIFDDGIRNSYLYGGNFGILILNEEWQIN